MTGHPSEYALDRAALGARVDDSVAAHLGACPRCAGMVAARRATSEPPAWLASVPLRAARPPRKRWVWLLPVPALAAVAALVLTRTAPPTSPALDAIRPKGTPIVTIYVKRGELVTPWDGRTPLRPGDRLRVAVRGAGYQELSIASLPPSGAPELLYGGRLERDAETLPPLSFRLDERGGTEVLSIILSMHPVTLSEHARLPGSGGHGVWAMRLRIPKEEMER